MVPKDRPVEVEALAHTQIVHRNAHCDPNIESSIHVPKLHGEGGPAELAVDQKRKGINRANVKEEKRE